MSDCAPRAPTTVSVHTNTISDARCATLRTSDLSAVDAFLASGARAIQKHAMDVRAQAARLRSEAHVMSGVPVFAPGVVSPPFSHA